MVDCHFVLNGDVDTEAKFRDCFVNSVKYIYFYLIEQ